MKKIDTLTKEQEAKIPIYLNKWLANGRKTSRLDRNKAVESIKTIYRISNMKEPENFLFFPSPIQCQLAVALLKQTNSKNFRNNLESNLWSNLWSNLENNLRSNLESNLESNLRNNLESNLWSNLGSNLRNNLWSNLENNLWSNLESNLGSNLWNNIESNLRNNLESNLWSNLSSNLWSNLWSNLGSNLPYEHIFYGNHWTAWVGFYDFILNELFEDKVEQFKDFTLYAEAVKNVHAFIPFENVVIICDNPTSINLDNSGRLHAEDTPALMYEDGYSLFYMNGIQIPKKFIETKRADINPKDVLALENTEQRMVLMRYVGLANYLKELNVEHIHEYKDYKLMYLTVEGTKIGPYLYMRCVSSGREFLEGVGEPIGDNTIDSSIKTCQDALKWRALKASKNLMSKFNLKWQYHS